MSLPHTPDKPQTLVDPAVAEQVADPDMPRAGWLRIRRTGIGSSDVSALVGLSNYRSATELWFDKTGHLPQIDEAPSEAAEMGTLLEPVVRDRFAHIHHLTVTRTGTWRSKTWPWMLASPDGFCSDCAGYEGKTCSHWLAHDWADGQTADHAELQAQWGMAVTGLGRWHVAVLIAGQRNEYRTIDRDDDLIATLVEASRRFWYDHVEANVAPEWGGSDAATRFLTDRYAVAEADIADIDEHQRDEIKTWRDKTSAARKAAETDDEAVKNHVRGLLGDRERLMCGDEQVATWKNTGQFSPKALRASYPDVAAAYTHTVTRDEIDTDTLATDHPDIYRACRARRLLFT